MHWAVIAMANCMIVAHAVKYCPTGSVPVLCLAVFEVHILSSVSVLRARFTAREVSWVCLFN